MAIDFKRIKLCATLSALAYDGTLADFTALGFRVAHVIHCPVTDTQGYVLHNDQEIFIVFRGTTNLKDWRTNIQVRKEAPNWLYPGNRCRVHRGFLAALNSVSKQIRKAIVNLRGALDMHLTITGHSLGGALAMLCAVDLEDSFEPVNQVITFGQPRVGNGVFRSFYNTMLGDRTIRVVNQIDAVPRGPLWIRGYRHAGRTHLFIDAAGSPEINPSLITLLVNDLICLGRDGLHIRWFTFGGLKVPIPFKISAASNHTMRDYSTYTHKFEEAYAA